MASRDPVQCHCKTNACTRVKGRAGEGTRGYCPCRENQTSCTYLCGCGQGKYACANKDHIPNDEDNLVDDPNDLSFECEIGGEESDEVISVYYGEEEVSVHASDTLNTSLQEAALNQLELNASKETSHTEEILEEERTEKKGKKKSSKGPKPAEAKGKRNSNLVPSQSQTKGRKNGSVAQRNSDVERVTSMVSLLSTDETQALVLKLAKMYPDLLEMAMGGDPPEPPPATQPSGWCKCGHCREMPTHIERLCCITSVNQICKLIVDAGPIYQLVLSKTTLENAVLNHNEYCIQNDDPNDNDTLRHMAYRKYVLWRRGYLGAGHRVVIPSCMVWAIRDKYPSADGSYTGFKQLIF